jgi:hypothetical protein
MIERGVSWDNDVKETDRLNVDKEKMLMMKDVDERDVDGPHFLRDCTKPLNQGRNAEIKKRLNAACKSWQRNTASLGLRYFKVEGLL